MAAVAVFHRPKPMPKATASVIANEAAILEAELRAASARNNAATDAVVAQSEVVKSTEERVRDTLRSLCEEVGSVYGSDCGTRR